MSNEEFIKISKEEYDELLMIKSKYEELKNKKCNCNKLEEKCTTDIKMLF